MKKIETIYIFQEQTNIFNRVRVDSRLYSVRRRCSNESIPKIASLRTTCRPAYV